MCPTMASGGSKRIQSAKQQYVFIGQIALISRECEWAKEVIARTETIVPALTLILDK